MTLDMDAPLQIAHGMVEYTKIPYRVEQGTSKEIPVSGNRIPCTKTGFSLWEFVLCPFLKTSLLYTLVSYQIEA